MKQLPIPSFFDSKNAGRWSYSPDQTRLFNDAVAFKRAHDIKPAASSKVRIHPLLIDVQKDFCFPWNDQTHSGGTLYVGGRSGTGAVDDSARIAQFIYRNSHLLTGLTTTLDTHFAFQIFSAPFWLTADGQPLSSHTLIDVGQSGVLVNLDLSGKVLHNNVNPNPALAAFLCNGDYSWLCSQAKFYCEELARGKKYKLYLWPPHTMLGSDGHALVGVVHEARLFFSYLRSVQTDCEIKGGNPLTENYSIFQPEVLMRWDGKPLAQRNTGFLKTMLGNDVVPLLGQAGSHCLKSSIEDLLTEIQTVDPKLLSRCYVVTDCSSAVAVPDGKGGFLADFTPQMEEAYQRFADAGMHLVKSTEPIESWPGVHLN